MAILSHKGLLAKHTKLSGRALQVGVCAAASSGFFLLGYDQGVMSGIITEPIFLETFPQMDQKNESGAIQALVVAIYEIGCLMGALGMVAYGDVLGRRRSILVGASIMIVGAILQTSSTTLEQMIVGRIVTGIGNGLNTSAIPVWQSEIAPPKIRGTLVLFEGALITFGIVLSYWVNYGFWFVRQYGSFQWRRIKFPIGFQILFAVMLIIGVLDYPESPRWLLKRGHREDAASIMADLADETVDDDAVKADIKEIDELNALTQSKRLSWKEFFGNGREMNGWRAGVACASQACQQITGINLETYYATTVFETSLNFDGTLSRFMTAWLGVEYFLAASVAVVVIDRFGRRKMMLFGAGGMATSLMVMGIALSQSTMEDKTGAYVATVFIFVYNTCFALGWLGVTWLYPAEVTPIRIRAQATGLSTASNWIFNYIVVQISPIMINTISWRTYFVFMCFNFAFVPLVYFIFPETNGYKLEQLDAIFAEAHDKGENPVFTGKRYRKQGGRLDVEGELEGREPSEDDDVEKDGRMESVGHKEGVKEDS